MGIVDQMQNILKLLEVAQDDLQAWVGLTEEEDLIFNIGEEGVEETKSLIAEIHTALHEVGA
ncbi:hypothetical protein [Paenibacillus polymyxa]|uniref:hypothetical protein n=1 Tax=Paenibacillus polymyxa TaxID=1406 RepID=UPI0003FFE52E|nr:hypothetical protein [Paenibacillus polymyxa]